MRHSFFRPFPILILFLLEPSPAAADLPVKPYAFDAGPASGIVDRFSMPLTRTDVYSDAKGFGWTTPVSGTFVRQKEYNGTLRDALTCDGVTAKTIGFRIDLPKGDWWFTFWMELGYEDSATTSLFINGTHRPLVWHTLKPDAEGRTERSSVYRVIHLKQALASHGFTFELRGTQDSVRFLGCTFIPAGHGGPPIAERLTRLIADAGRYGSSISSSLLLSTLTKELENNRQAAQLFYWRQQVGLMAEAERLRDMAGWEWATQMTGVSIFDRMHQALMLLDANVENSPSGDNPLLERVRWSRGKICYDLVLERGGDYQGRIGREDLRWLFTRYPGDRTLAMLNGQRINLPDPSDHLPVPGAPPRWAMLEREAISRLKSEIDWWVNSRRAANGELGGKIDDDVEILREWIPLLLLGDETTIRGWKRLADAVWTNPRVLNGYSRHVRDVEHSAEFISDSTPELIVVDDDSTYLKRLMFTPDYFEHLWSGKNRFGRRFFKSAWLGATGIDERPPRNRDVEMNSRALKPLRYLAWATRDARYVRLTEEWARAWLSASLRTDKGKPAGIIPASIRWPDEMINGDEPTWYDSNMMWDYYAWSDRCGSAILDHLVFTYDLTGDSSLLEPLELTLRLIRRQMQDHSDIRTGTFAAGSEPWAAQRLLRNQAFWSPVQKWRMLTGNAEFDDLIASSSTPYLKYRLTQAEEHLEEGLLELLGTLRYNTGLRTDLVVHTDRVRIPGIEHLKAMISGDATPEGNSPYFAVSWRGMNEHLAVLVKEAADSHVTVETYNFNDELRTVIMRPWRLSPGRYTLALRSGERVTTTTVAVAAPGQQLPVPLPPHVRTEIVLKRQQTAPDRTTAP